jgi:hypothetical protein
VRLTLRTLLAYLDDTLPADEAKTIGEKLAESEPARELVDRIRKLTRKRSLAAPGEGDPGSPADPNVVSDYLSDTLFSDEVATFEEACLGSDVTLAEVSSCHQILTLTMSEPVRVPPTARQRMYKLVKGPESLPHRPPGATMPVGGELPEGVPTESFDPDATLLLGVPALAAADTGAKKAYPILIGVVLFLGMLVAGFLAWPKTEALKALKDDRVGGGPIADKATIPSGESSKTPVPSAVPSGEQPKPMPQAVPPGDQPEPNAKPVVDDVKRELAPPPRPVGPN